MNKLKKWQIKHCINQEAMNDLSDLLGFNLSFHESNIVKYPVQSEKAIQADCRLYASRMCGRLWRNNVGVAIDRRGIPVRYGLCNESKKMNEMVKSSDLIGIKPILITHHHIGSVIGQFWALEIKKGDWFYTGTDREKAQLKFHQIVNDLGGDAEFINNVEKL